MNKLLKKSKEIIVLISWFIPFFSSIYMWNENWQRSLVLIVALIIWIVGYVRSKEKQIFPILFLLAISTLNITFTFSGLDSCFKHSVIVNYLCPTVSIVDLFAVLALVVTLLHIPFRKVTKSIFIALPLLMYGIVHLLLHPNFNSAIVVSRLLILVLLFVLALPKLIKYINDGKKIFPYLLYPLLFQLIIASLQVFLRRDLNLQFLGESNLLAGTINSSFISSSTGELLRAYGTFPHPNILAGFALAVSLIALRVYRKKDISLWVILGVSALIIALTFSRIHIVLLLVSLCIVGIFQMKNRLFAIVPFFVERFQALTFGSTSVKERLILFNESLKVLKDNWLIGVGSGEFVRYISNDVRTESNISLFQPVHNIFLLTLAEHGVIGTLILLPYFIYLLLASKKGLLFISISLICILGIGMFDHYLISLPQGIIILMLLLL